MSWEMQPGDGTGSSPADAEVRNKAGLCAIQNCGKPLKEGYRVCEDCARAFADLEEEWAIEELVKIAKELTLYEDVPLGMDR